MSGLDPTRREEARALLDREEEAAYASGTGRGLGVSDTLDLLAPLIARWLADARAEGAAERGRGCCGYDTGYADGKAEGAAEVRARVEPFLDGDVIGTKEIRDALAEPTDAAEDERP